ncbi:MAG TPA: hypothetical protein VJ845_04235 [Haploplasma sp.]|nr:hypothetical protein [Haploplasma sp.]
MSLLSLVISKKIAPMIIATNPKGITRLIIEKMNVTADKINNVKTIPNLGFSSLKLIIDKTKQGVEINKLTNEVEITIEATIPLA